MMDRFYSALVVNGRLIQRVFKPRYNREYFKRLVANIDSLGKVIEKRCKSSSFVLSDRSSLIEFEENIRKILKLKDQAENIKDHGEFKDLQEQVEALEQHVLPRVLSIPNRHSEKVPQTDIILNQIESDWPKKGVSKMLSHTKLSYINNCYSKSVVGYNSYYYFGIAAKLHHGIKEYFMQNLEQKDFIPFSGLCLAKSAVVEAVNSKDHKDYFTDPCRILTEDSRFTTTHLVEASRESLVGFLTTLGHRSTNEPMRLVTSGSGYSTGSDWFDSDDKRASQFETVHALSLTPSVNRYSTNEYLAVRDMVWNLYTALGLPIRLVQCSLSSMRSNEYDTHRIDTWLPSRSQWIETARISHYLDYITVRTGMKRGHIIDSSVYDSRALVASIIENNQTYEGKFVIPTVIEGYMPHMTQSELDGYFRPGPKSRSENPPVSNAFCNYQQRRYLAKRPYLFSHSKRAARNNTIRTSRAKAIFFAFMFMICHAMIDWEIVWVDFTPLAMKAFLYDYIFRPARRLYWSTIYVGGTVKPPDTPFDELDHSQYDKPLGLRRKEVFSKFLTRGKFISLDKKGTTNDGQDEKIPDLGAESH